MLEIEMKFPVADLDAVATRLRAAGAVPGTERDDADTYFNAPDRDFARTDEAFRLRQIGGANFVTYKGPKSDPHTKTRTEIEVPLAEGPTAAEGFSTLVRALGYRPVAVVRKRRRTFHLARDGFDLECCLDDVPEVGRFVELEILAQPERLDEAKAVLHRVAGELGLSGSERRSYLEMLLTARAGRKP